MEFFLEIVRLGLANIRRHALRSFLTALGIILGVAAVITNASIGEGSKRQALERLERLGATNIILESRRPADSATAGGQTSFVVRYGISREDLEVIRQNFPDSPIVPLKAVGSQLLRDNIRITSQAFGTTPDLLGATNLKVARGRYLTDSDMQENAKVAVLGAEAAKDLFQFGDPLGQTIRIDRTAFEIVGVLEPVGLAAGRGASLVGRNVNSDVHIPLTTADEAFRDFVQRMGSGQRSFENVQLSAIYLLAPSRDAVLHYAQLMERIVEARHPGKTDVSLTVPLELLEAAKQAALTWNIVLTSIAGISLLVGGIGIMNIMLASVTERTREIGIRRALGARRADIVSQFLVETGVLSCAGAAVGVAAGVLFSLLVPVLVRALNAPSGGGEAFQVALTPWSMVTSFSVAAVTGLGFGLYPAVRASRQDPIVALRHD